MASKPKSGPQDMPPPGGFNAIQTGRVAIRRLISPNIATALTVGTIGIGYIAYAAAYKDYKREEVEMMSARNVIWCLQLAERDRTLLKHIRRSRDAERELMKDYPGWEVGTYFGEPVYEGANPEELIEPTFNEYMVHSEINAGAGRYFRYLLT